MSPILTAVLMSRKDELLRIKWSLDRSHRAISDIQHYATSGLKSTYKDELAAHKKNVTDCTSRIDEIMAEIKDTASILEELAHDAGLDE